MKKRSLILVLALGILSLAGCGKETVNEQPDTSIEESAGDDLKETEVSEKGETEEKMLAVYPMPSLVNPDNLQDGTVAIAVEEGAIYSDEEQWKMKVSVYDQELYDQTAIGSLTEGSAIVINQEEVTVTAIETNELGTVIINNGLDEGGYELMLNEDGRYYSIGYSDVRNYCLLGETELVLSPEFVYKDASDLDAGEKEYTVSEIGKNAVAYEGTPHNTTIVIEDGMVTSMTKVYTP